MDFVVKYPRISSSEYVLDERSFRIAENINEVEESPSNEVLDMKLD